MLDSEVMDLRVCLRSADKEIAEIKTEMKEERHTHQTKSMEYIQRVGVGSVKLHKIYCYL